MVKQSKKSAKKKIAKQKLSTRQITLACIGLLVLAGLVLWGVQTVLHNRAVAKERAQFMAVKADLHELAQQIAKEVGPPTASKEEQSCSYTSVVYGRGQLSCDSNLFIFYEESDNISVDAKLLRVINNRYSTLKELPASRNIDNFRNDSLSIKGSDCTINYWHVYNNNENLSYVPINLNNKTGTLGVISCGHNALKPYFQVVKN